jgi:hypothetical protein
VIAAFGALILSYQNCTKSTVGFRSSDSKGSVENTTTDNGNGGTYDGKPSVGNYVRRSGSSCSSLNNLIGLFNVSTVNAALSNDICVTMDYAIEFSDTRLEFSFYNQDFLGLNDAIFERTVEASPAASGPIVDLWCRYVDSDFGLDVVVKSTGSTSTQATVYVGRSLSSTLPQARKLNPIAATKSSSATLLVAASTDGSLRTEVDISNPAEMKHPGRAVMRLDGEDLDLPVSCRVASNSPALYEKPTNILAMFQMDQPLGPASNGTVLVDSSRYGSNATLANANGTGASFVNGLVGNALSFDGIDDNFDLSSHASAGATGFTFSAWVVPTTTTPDQTIIFGIFSSGYSNLLRVGVGICDQTPTDADQGRLTLDEGGTCYDSGIDLRDGQWHMVTMSYGSGNASLYLDGNFIGQYPVAATLGASNIWALGQDYDSATNQNDRYQGLMDEVVLWNTPLSAAEVKTIYDSKP